MTRDNDKQPEDSDDDLNEFARDPFKRTAESQAGLEGFEEDEEPANDLEDGLREDYDDDYDDDPYDEPERDTAYPPAYREEDDDTGDDYYEDRQPLLRETAARQESPEDDEQGDEQDDYLDEELDDEPDEDTDETSGDNGRWNTPRLTASDTDNWLEDTPYNDGQDDMETQYAQRLPMGLLIVAVIAVVLLVAGGYGVMQQRAESNEEIRQLRGALATAASSEDIEKARAEAEALRAEKNDLEDRVYDLEIENRKLLDLIAGLEAQVEALNATAPVPASPKPTPVPAPKPAPAEKAPEPAKPAATAAAGTWFVNFGSYGQLSAAQAWQARLQPASGDVITAPGEREGKTFYRVRVVNLPDKATAQDVARALEQQYNLPKLWVGQQ